MVAFYIYGGFSCLSFLSPYKVNVKMIYQQKKEYYVTAVWDLDNEVRNDKWFLDLLSTYNYQKNHLYIQL